MGAGAPTGKGFSNSSSNNCSHGPLSLRTPEMRKLRVALDETDE